MEWTQEKMHSLQQLHITLHGALTAQPQCAINTTFPYKPVLVIRSAPTAAASSSAPATPASIEIPLSARVNLSSSRTSLALSPPDATVISLGMTADLEPAANEEAFPSARELDAREYAQCYCRHCGTLLFAPRSPPIAPFTVHSLPSAYWSELTDLWFCHTTDNAHMAKLASLQITVAKGKIMVDKMGLRVHQSDLAEPQAWRMSESVARLTREATAAAGAAASSSAAPAAASSSVAPREIWSPLPCVGCRAVLGSILLTLRPCADPSAAVQVASSGEVRLLKYQLSNCFRKRPTHALPVSPGTAAISVAGAALTGSSMEDVAEEQKQPVPSSSASAVAATGSSSSAALLSSSSPSPSCLCSSYSAPAASSVLGDLRLTCSNVWKSYTFESLVAEDLLARFQKQPANKFVIESIDDDAEAHASTAPKLFLRLLVTHWNLSLSSTLQAAFPFTPAARSSNRMVPVIKLEFSAHDSEEDAALQKWTTPPKAGSAQPIEKIHYALSDCRALLELLRLRSGCWPRSLQAGTLDPAMRKSCLVKLHALPDK